MYVFVDAVRFVVLELDCKTDDVELELAFVAEPNELSFLRRNNPGEDINEVSLVDVAVDDDDD